MNNTMFAPAERLPVEAVKQQVQAIKNKELLDDLYSAVSDIVLILNKQRQVIYFSETLLEVMGITDKNSICLYGLRPGEVFQCEHAYESDAGCGTTEFCRECGAVKAILSSQKGKPDIQECRIIKKDTGDALNLRIKTSQIRFGGEEYTIVGIMDTTHEKWRRALERIFFHDVMNTAVGVRGLSELLSMAEEEQLEEFRNMIHTGAAKLVDEITAQRDLTKAENNELQLNYTVLNSLDVLKQVKDIYKMHPVSKDKTLEIVRQAQDVKFQSDSTLLMRVIGNMTKNALEATPEGGTVKIGCCAEDDKIRFYVNNPSFIPRNIQLQLFQRSFSTKGTDRGFGTYSMKLLSERYLKGAVSFVSSEDNGTTFSAEYPLMQES